ncbi:unnamed protein product [Arabis nemorensis]|uniref:RRM domain-containing protein n=1 Tax=Arabis nemorensis TaxID=586526 RepID=A0A565BZ26_9BRAS|nr:unnamed protein product [Arabis nemorensis]
MLVGNPSELSYFKAFEKRLTATDILKEEELSRCTVVSVEGYDTSLRPYDIRAILTRYFGSCGNICDVVIPTYPSSSVVERVGFIFFRDEGAQEKALALSGSNVGFPFPGIRLGGWDVYVKACPRHSFALSPDQVAAARRLINAIYYCGFAVTGYPTSLAANDVRSALFRLFRSCGEIRYLTVEDDPSQPGLLQRSGFVSLSGEGALEKVVELDGSDMGGWNVAVLTEPKPNEITVSRANQFNIGWEGPPGLRWVDLHPSTASSVNPLADWLGRRIK